MKEAHVCENVEDVILLQHLLVGLLLKVSKGQCNPREQSDLSPEALLEMVESAWSAGSAHDWTLNHGSAESAIPHSPRPFQLLRWSTFLAEQTKARSGIAGRCVPVWAGREDAGAHPWTLLCAREWNGTWTRS